VITVILLGLTSFFTDISSEMAYPLVPFVLSVSFGASPAALGLIEGLAESAASLLRLFSGALSDRFGKKKPLTAAGYGASAIGKALLAAATSWGFVLAARVVDRIGKGVRTAPRDALIADAAGSDRRGFAYGLHRTLDHAGAVTGIAIAWLTITIFGTPPATVFLWSVIPAVVGVVLLLFVRERAKETKSRSSFPSLRLGLLPGALKQFLLISGIFALGNSSNAFLLLRGIKGGIPFPSLLLLYLGSTVVAMISSIPAGWLSDRVGRKGLLIAAYLLYAAVYAGFGILGDTHDTVPFAFLFAVYGAYTGIAEGVEKAYVVDMAPPETRATAIGMHAMVVGIMLLPSSLLAGLLWDLLGAGAPFLAGAGLATLAATGLALRGRTS
jgi:MFS family permease